MNDHHKKHKVKVHTWTRGILEIVEHEFHNLTAALNFAHTAHRLHNDAVYEHPTDQNIKIYDEEGQCVHSTDGSTDTYA